MSNFRDPLRGDADGLDRHDRLIGEEIAALKRRLRPLERIEIPRARTEVVAPPDDDEEPGEATLETLFVYYTRAFGGDPHDFNPATKVVDTHDAVVFPNPGGRWTFVAPWTGVFQFIGSISTEAWVPDVGYATALVVWMDLMFDGAAYSMYKHAELIIITSASSGIAPNGTFCLALTMGDTVSLSHGHFVSGDSPESNSFVTGGYIQVFGYRATGVVGPSTIDGGMF